MEEQISLKPYNTFGIDVAAEKFERIYSIESLQECLQLAKDKSIPATILGGGSNILFTKNVKGLVIQNSLTGIEKLQEDEDYVYLKAGGGEVWHRFVLYCLEHNYAGVENLVLIPGLVGASPMQNIGAYGVEIKEVFYELTAVHRHDLTVHTFSNGDCAFGYRESIFKNRYKDQLVITDVTYRLHKKPQFKIEYGAVKQELEKQGVQALSIRAVADAVMAIRSSKLPNPKKIGNAGSFFKNPSVSKEQFEQLKAAFPTMIAYENPDGTVKLAAGWLIEQCGLKGYRQGDAGVHEKQALVLVNYGNATGPDILKVCALVQRTVSEKFNIELSPEVNIL
ncbi:MAG: UDP-N-acetylmuramate dehydrogenase [Niabella sp.]